MKKKLTLEEVKHVAKLANIPLSSKELQKFTVQLSEVIDFNISLLEKVNTDGVEPAAHVTGIKNALREDEVEPGLTSTQVLSNTKKTHNNFFQVKAVIDKQ